MITVRFIFDTNEALFLLSETGHAHFVVKLHNIKKNFFGVVVVVLFCLFVFFRSHHKYFFVLLRTVLLNLDRQASQSWRMGFETALVPHRG